MNRKKTIPIIVIALLLIAVIAVVTLVNRGKNNAKGIAVSGNIEFTRVNISFKTPGKIEKLLIDEGDEVKADMLVAQLDQAQLLHQQEKANAAIALIESRTAQTRTAIQYGEESLRGQVAQREAEVSSAEAGLRDLKAGSRSQEIEQARANLERARVEKEQAEKDWVRAQQLYKAEDISTADHDRARTRYETSLAALRAAEQQLALVVEGPRKEMIAAGSAQVARSKAGLQLAEAARLDVKRQKQELKTRQAELDQAKAERAGIETMLRDTVAISPVSGIVLVRSVEQGEVVGAGTSILTIGDIDHPWLRAYINETELGKVKLGAKVRVTSDSFPGKVYWGKVTFISSEAEFTPKQIQTKEERVKMVYRIKIEVENPNRELKLNMPVDAIIQFE